MIKKVFKINAVVVGVFFTMVFTNCRSTVDQRNMMGNNNDEDIKIVNNFNPVTEFKSLHQDKRNNIEESNQFAKEVCVETSSRKEAIGLSYRWMKTILFNSKEFFKKQGDKPDYVLKMELLKQYLGNATPHEGNDSLRLKNKIPYVGFNIKGENGVNCEWRIDLDYSWIGAINNKHCKTKGIICEVLGKDYGRMGKIESIFKQPATLKNITNTSTDDNFYKGLHINMSVTIGNTTYKHAYSWFEGKEYDRKKIKSESLEKIKSICQDEEYKYLEILQKCNQALVESGKNNAIKNLFEALTKL